MTLISASDPGVVDSWITLDHRRLRISVEAEELSFSDKERLIAELQQLLSQRLPGGWSSSLTGTAAITFRYDADFRQSQTTIISASSLIVFVAIGLYLRSVSWALLAMIPNAVALLLLFGAMGHMGINLDFGSAIVAPIAIGIAADDTVHFLTAYARERRSGLSPVSAVRGAISKVGEAVIATTIALALGFLSMMTSPFPNISNIGLLGAVAILAATAADLLVLPALIATVAQWKGFGGAPGRHG
jgi:hypothetical protein